MNYLGKQQREIHPKERANVVSNLSFLYTLKLLKKGFQHELEERDLYEVPSHFKSKKLGDYLEHNWKKQDGQKKRSTLYLLCYSYAFCYLGLGLIKLLSDTILIIVQPYAIGKLISYFTPGQKTLSKNHAYLYMVIIVTFSVLECVYRHNYSLFVTGFGIKIRAAFSSFIYRRLLKLDIFGTKISIGRIINLVTKDVQTFESFVEHGNELWITVVKLAAVGYLLYNKIGPVALTGIGFFLLIIPLHGYIGMQVASLKTEMLKKGDERLQMTQEVLSAIKAAKICTWENFYEFKIGNARQKEVNTMYKIFFLRIIGLTIGSLNSRVAIYVLIMTYLWCGYNITAEIIYFIIASFNLLSENFSVLFPIAVHNTAELITATRRIATLINAQVKTPPWDKISETASPIIKFYNSTVNINNKTILQQIAFKLQNGLTVMTGATGSGKTILLKKIFQHSSESSVTVDGTISYASQEPWLFPSTIRQNILIDEKYDEKRYHKVLRVCDLLYDLELFEDGDLTIVKDRGHNLSKGQKNRINLARAIYKHSDIYLLDDCLSGLDSEASDSIFKECIQNFLKNKLVLLVSYNKNYLKIADNFIILQDGKITYAPRCKSEQNKNIIWRSIRHKTVRKIKKEKNCTNHTQRSDESEKLLTGINPEGKVYNEMKEAGKVELWNYTQCIKLGGGLLIFTILFNTFVLAQFVSSCTDKLVSKWIYLEEIYHSRRKLANNLTLEDYQLQRYTIFRSYTFMVIAIVVTSLIRSVAVLIFTRRISINMHKKLLTSIIHAPMEFFNQNFIGNILNRFSTDLVILDEALPFVLDDFLQIILKLISIITLIAHIHIIFLIPTLLLFVIMFVLRRCYLRTGRNLRRLDISVKSTVIGHLNATLEGLDSVKALKLKERLLNEYHEHLDLCTSTHYTFQCTVRAFTFALDIICTVYVAVTIITFLVMDDGNTLVGDAGLAISQAFMLTDGPLQHTFYLWTELETQMTSVERILQYTKNKCESESGFIVENWPKLGEIQFEDIAMSYDHKNDVLRKINFALKPHENAGIVSRMGDGKSSMVSIFHKLYNFEGIMIIDGVSLNALSPEYVRSRISVVPQESVLFTGTIRENIDPMQQCTDEELWRICEDVNAKSFVSALDEEVVNGGCNFSIGQKQLISLARAIAQKNKIVVLDEATADLDPDSEDFVCGNLQKAFESCTVVILGNKLHPALNCDKLLILNRGEIVECGSPLEDCT